MQVHVYVVPMNDNQQTLATKCLMQLEELEIRPSKILRNIAIPELLEVAIHRREGELSITGALSVKTGKFTGRSPDDRYIVDDDITHSTIDWGKINHPLSEDKFEMIFARMRTFVEGKEFFIFDGFVGADHENKLPIRVITDKAWQNLFASQIFIRPTNIELVNHDPKFTLLSVNDFGAAFDPEGTRSETFIIINFKKNLVLIGSTSYAGEIKKAMFSVMNYLLPLKGVFPMHCSANVGRDGDTALFFGLSGTGKTTLSADPERQLIGDDEHGWSDEGIFNFEGGCYAKVIKLSRDGEPEIYATTEMFGTVLENVDIDPRSGAIDLNSARITENTRASYPIHYIPNHVPEGIAGHPRHVVFLTCDAFGVMPPIAKLTPEQAMYHFLSGYTAKVAGTERGVTEPKETFSACFGAPFLPLHPSVYARMLGERIARHDVQCWLVNTGWTAGPYGVGHRMDLKSTRAMIRAALAGELDNVATRREPTFGLEVPTHVPGVSDDQLDPRTTWKDPATYDAQAEKLTALFRKNFEQFATQVPRP